MSEGFEYKGTIEVPPINYIEGDIPVEDFLFFLAYILLLKNEKIPFKEEFSPIIEFVFSYLSDDNDYYNGTF